MVNEILIVIVLFGPQLIDAELITITRFAMAGVLPFIAQITGGAETHPITMLEILPLTFHLHVT